MSDFEIPGERDFPRGQLERRASHLVSELRARRSRRRALIVIPAAAVLLLGAAFAAAASTSVLGRDIVPFFPPPDDVVGEPVQVGPRVLLAEGKAASGARWTLSAYRSDSGLCLDLAFRRGIGGGCGGGLRGEPEGEGRHWVGFGANEFATDPEVFVAGPAARGVGSVELELAGGGRARTRMIEAPAELGAPINFYFAVLAHGARVHAVVARDGSGAVLQRRVVD
jgi:hypothetical protein